MSFISSVLLLLTFYRKKGKKEGKKSKKESVLKDAIANAKLWETKLEALEKSRQEYRYHFIWLKETLCALRNGQVALYSLMWIR